MSVLPKRFWPDDDLTPFERDERMKRWHFSNLKAKDVKVSLRQRFTPMLKERGFIKVKEGRWVRACTPYYHHIVEIRFSANFPGRFWLRLGIALDFLPSASGAPSDPKTITLDSDCLFTNTVKLANGVSDFDNGQTVEETEETIDYLIDAFITFDKNWFALFRQFPEPLSDLGPDFVREAELFIEQNRDTRFGEIAATPLYLTWKLAVIRQFIGDEAGTAELAEFALKHFTPNYLQSRFEALKRR